MHSPCFEHLFEVPRDAIDQNGHVNNVVYVQWMQDVAIEHSTACGGLKAMENAGGAWVVRTHHIEYLRPAFALERLVARTWVENFNRVQSDRRYEFRRAADGTLLARGQTTWVFINAQSGRPLRIPDELIACYQKKDPS